MNVCFNVHKHKHVTYLIKLLCVMQDCANCSCTLNEGKLAGIIIGSVFGALFVVMCSWYLIRCIMTHRKRMQYEAIGFAPEPVPRVQSNDDVDDNGGACREKHRHKSIDVCSTDSDKESSSSVEGAVECIDLESLSKKRQDLMLHRSTYKADNPE